MLALQVVPQETLEHQATEFIISAWIFAVILMIIGAVFSKRLSMILPGLIVGIVSTLGVMLGTWGGNVPIYGGIGFAAGCVFAVLIVLVSPTLHPYKAPEPNKDWDLPLDCD